MSEYGDRLRAKGIAVLSRGLSKDKIVLGRDEAGAKTKTTIDQLGNEVTEHNNKQDQVDVKIKAPHVRVGAQEVRDV